MNTTNKTAIVNEAVLRALFGLDKTGGLKPIGCVWEHDDFVFSEGEPHDPDCPANNLYAVDLGYLKSLYNLFKMQHHKTGKMLDDPSNFFTPAQTRLWMCAEATKVVEEFILRMHIAMCYSNPATDVVDRPLYSNENVKEDFKKHFWRDLEDVQVEYMPHQHKMRMVSYRNYLTATRLYQGCMFAPTPASPGWTHAD